MGLIITMVALGVSTPSFQILWWRVTSLSLLLPQCLPDFQCETIPSASPSSYGLLSHLAISRLCSIPSMSSCSSIMSGNGNFPNTVGFHQCPKSHNVSCSSAPRLRFFFHARERTESPERLPLLWWPLIPHPSCVIQGRVFQTSLIFHVKHPVGLTGLEKTEACGRKWTHSTLWLPKVSRSSTNAHLVSSNSLIIPA